MFENYAGWIVLAAFLTPMLMIVIGYCIDEYDRDFYNKKSPKRTLRMRFEDSALFTHLSIFKCFDVTAWIANLFGDWDDVFNSVPKINSTDNRYSQIEDCLGMGRAADRHFQDTRSRFSTLERQGKVITRLVVFFDPITRQRIASRAVFAPHTGTKIVTSVLTIEKEPSIFLYENTFKERLRNTTELAAERQSVFMMIQDQWADKGCKCSAIRWLPICRRIQNRLESIPKTQEEIALAGMP